MHTTNVPNTTATNRTTMTKMFSLFRKSSKSTVMANPNTSETTLVSPPSASSKGGKESKPKRKPKYETEPYAAEFTGLSTMGGMPSLGGHFFMEPPKATKKGTSAPKFVPSQPFKESPRASFVQERLSAVQGMFQPSSSPAPMPSLPVSDKYRSTSGSSSSSRLSAREMVEHMYTPTAMMIGGVVAPTYLRSSETTTMVGTKKNKNEKVQ